MNERKPILCLDFDGVIHDYREGWRGGEIYGNATPGFFAWAVKAMRLFRLVVYSSRSATPEGQTAMGEAIGKWSIDAIERGEVPSDFDWGGFFPHLEFASEKPPAFVTIDDRALQFWGDWDQFDPEQLRGFTPWMVSRESQRLTYSKPKDQEGNFEKVCHDLHQALGVKWGDDVYAEIKRLREIAGRNEKPTANDVAGPDYDPAKVADQLRHYGL